MLKANMNKIRISSNLLIFAGLIVLVLVVGLVFTPPAGKSFEGERAFIAAQSQMNFGPRTPGSDSHQKWLVWAEEELQLNGWSVNQQDGYFRGKHIQNRIAKKGSSGPLVILGAHYDSRLVADKDPAYPALESPVPGANDGASGVAVLMELARSLDVNENMQVWLVMIDAEDQGNLPGWEWILGSRFFVENLIEVPAAVVIVDMVGDQDLTLPREVSSNAALQDEIWKTGQNLGYGDIFLDQRGYYMLDDHTPFLEKDIPAVDIIDFDYPYWHTTQDTLDKISVNSLEAVGKTLETWLENYPHP